MDCERIENETSQQLLKLYQKSDQLKENQKQSQQSMKTEHETTIQDYQDILAAVEGDFAKKFSELYERYTRAQNNLKQDDRKFKEVFAQNL